MRCSMVLKEKQLALQILTACTLNCEYCADYTPAYQERKNHFWDSYEDACQELNGIFSIYSYIEDFTITGGEPLLHKQLPQILEEAMKYQEQFSKCRIFTNGTILPGEQLVKIAKKNKDKFMFVIDHYGSVSTNVEQMAELLEKSEIEYRINKYYGKDSHCGGWIDYGSPDYYRNYTEEKVNEIIKHCHNALWKNLVVFKGKLYLCTQGCFGSDLGCFTLKPEEYIDLLKQDLSLEQKQQIAKEFGTKPTTACQYCNGFDVEKSKRVPAGEQKPRKY